MSSKQTYTVLGAKGFIGAALVAWLESQGQMVHGVTRASLPAILATRRPAGHVIDCIGLISNSCSRPQDTAEAHVGIVARCLTDLRFDSFLLLSSTRVYCRASTTHEGAVLPFLPTNTAELNSVMKLAGEALCLSNSQPGIRVARLSNVYGIGMPAETFLEKLLRNGTATGQALFPEEAATTDDYVSIAAVVRLLPAIAIAGHHRIYNLAAGTNTSHDAIAQRLQDIAGWRIIYATNANAVLRPPIDTTRIETEFGPTRSNLVADLPLLLALSKEARCSQSMRQLAA